MSGTADEIDKEKAKSPIEILAPATIATPVIYASPHSGRRYPIDLLRLTRLDRQALRQSEDSYVDLLFDSAPDYGAPMLRALFPRAYVDVNRSQFELDPRMFSEPLPRTADSRSTRVLAGLGVVPRIVADGHDIYNRKLTYIDVRRRLSTCYEPYHDALRALIAQAHDRFGCAILIDCHSMPSIGGAPLREGERRTDFVLGDRFGASCSPAIVSLVERTLEAAGFKVARNSPYAGGYVASTYGRPAEGVHVLQIEINRALYLDEAKIARTAGFESLRAVIQLVIGALSTVDAASLRPALAAE